MEKDLQDALGSLFGYNNDNANSTDRSLAIDRWLRPFRNESLVPVSGARLSRSVPEVVGLSFMYAIIVVCSVIGNSLVVVIVAMSRRMHTVTNIFIMNLALSDLLMTVLNIPFNLVRNILEDWPFGGFMCALVQASMMVSVYASSFTMVAIALDRYLVIVYPLRPRMTRHVAMAVVGVSWVAAIALSLPYALYARVEVVELLLKAATRCRLAYPEPSDVYERSLTLVTLMTQYLIPMGMTAAAYGHIVRVLWSRNLIGSAPDVAQRLCHQRARRRTIRMLIVVVTIFCVCWLPLQLYHVLTDFVPEARSTSKVYLTCHWLAMSSVCYNPIVYCGLNASFRQLVRMRCACCCCCCSSPHPPIEEGGKLMPAGHALKPTDPMVRRCIRKETAFGAGSQSSSSRPCPVNYQVACKPPVSPSALQAMARESSHSSHRGTQPHLHPSTSLMRHATRQHADCACNSHSNCHNGDLPPIEVTTPKNGYTAGLDQVEPSKSLSRKDSELVVIPNAPSLATQKRYWWPFCWAKKTQTTEMPLHIRMVFKGDIEENIAV